MSEIGKIIRETDEELTLDLSDKHLRMSRGNVTFVCRLLEGDFINYESVIPAETSTETVVDTALLIDSIERASVVINEKMRSPIILRFEETGVGVSCVSSLGKVIDRVHAVTKGPELELGVNNRYILDALKACETQGVRVCMQSSLSPMMILPLEGDDFLFIVVPMRYKNRVKNDAEKPQSKRMAGAFVRPARAPGRAGRIRREKGTPDAGITDRVLPVSEPGKSAAAPGRGTTLIFGDNGRENEYNRGNLAVLLRKELAPRPTGR